MGTAGEALALGHAELVINPVVFGIPGPGIKIIGRNQDVFRARNILEILVAPGIAFADGHGRSFLLEHILIAKVYNPGSGPGQALAVYALAEPC